VSFLVTGETSPVISSLCCLVYLYGVGVSWYLRQGYARCWFVSFPSVMHLIRGYDSPLVVLVVVTATVVKENEPAQKEKQDELRSSE
jgi:hypothetical protein